MKAFMLACFLMLACCAAHAATLVELKPYPDSPYPNAPFSLAAQCHLNGLDADGAWTGTCRYYGYGGRNSPSGFAVVTWATDGTPLSATPCAFTGCPSKVYGPFQLLYPTPTDPIHAWVQGMDSAGNTGVNVDTVPQYPALIVP